MTGTLPVSCQALKAVAALIIMTKGTTTNLLKEEKVYFGLEFQRISVCSWQGGMAGQEWEAASSDFHPHRKQRRAAGSRVRL